MSYKQFETILTAQTNFQFKLNFEVSKRPSSRHRHRINCNELTARCLLKVKQTVLGVDKIQPASNRISFRNRTHFDDKRR